MIGYLVLASALAFGLFLVPGPHRRFAGCAGWTGMVLVLIALLPEFTAENNFVYPALTLASVPFLWITVRRLLVLDPPVLALTRGAAIAFVLYAPFAFYPPLGNWLIGVVVAQLTWLLDAIGFQYGMWAWNVLIHNGLRVEIILACTGIQSIAIMLGVAFAVPASFRERALAFLVVAPVIYLLNLLRNVFVVIAYTDQWFPFLPEIAGNGEFGYESFFWAHNVLAELGALVILVLIAWTLFSLIPALGDLAADLVKVYRADLMRVVGRGR
ncbi:MAG TPA: archaeosortase A [Methanoregulaceae archaeon]|nr:archaeosortase A [Methanoregulaceae archaeon]